jgi:hypothetical protein
MRPSPPYPLLTNVHFSQWIRIGVCLAASTWYVLSPISLPVLIALTVQQPSDAPYCSAECLTSDRPSIPTAPLDLPYRTNSSSLHTLSDSDRDAPYDTASQISPNCWRPGSDHEGIRLWAANIPHGSSDGTLPSKPPRASSRSSSRPMRTPKLLLSNLRPAVASLCMSTVQPSFPEPSKPLITPQQSITSMNFAKSAGSMTMSSLHSAITDSVIATPSSARVANTICTEQQQEQKYNMPHMLDTLAVHVRSWVAPFPQPQHKYASSHRASKQATFPIDPFTQFHGGLHSVFDDSGSDDDLVHEVWWAKEGSIEKKNSTVRRKPSRPMQPRHRQSVTVSDDHPAYHARGRKISRAFNT